MGGRKEGSTAVLSNIDSMGIDVVLKDFSSGVTQVYCITNAEMERRVAAKAKKLPDRIQQLIDDVSLLYYREHLNAEEVEVWENLLNANNRSRKVRDYPVVRTAQQIPSGETETGFEIGTLVRMIHEESVPADFVWGTIIDLVGKSSEEWECEDDREDSAPEISRARDNREVTLDS